MQLAEILSIKNSLSIIKYNGLVNVNCFCDLKEISLGEVKFYINFNVDTYDTKKNLYNSDINFLCLFISGCYIFVMNILFFKITLIFKKNTYLEK